MAWYHTNAQILKIMQAISDLFWARLLVRLITRFQSAHTLQLYFINGIDSPALFISTGLMPVPYGSDSFCILWLVLAGSFFTSTFRFISFACRVVLSFHQVILFWMCVYFYLFRSLCSFFHIDRIACVMICCSIVWRNWIIHQPLKSWEPFTSISFRYVQDNFFSSCMTQKKKCN